MTQPPSSSPGAGVCWYLVRTKVRAESFAQTQLERQGYVVCYPRAVRIVRCRGRALERIEPLFPRYVFVRLDVVRQSLGPVRNTFGVSEIVRFGEKYAVIPERVVCALIDNADPVSGLHRLKEPRFVRGAPVHVSGGAFGGLEGVFERYEGEQRVLILLEVLGRQTRICMQAHQVVAGHAY